MPPISDIPTEPSSGNIAYSDTFLLRFCQSIEMETMGSRLRKLRKQRRLDQVEVAAALDWPRSTLANIESDGDTPGLAKFVALAQYYKVSLDYLWTGKPSLPPDSGELIENPDERALLNFWRGLNHDERLMVTRLLRGIETSRDSAA